MNQSKVNIASRFKVYELYTKVLLWYGRQKKNESVTIWVKIGEDKNLKKKKKTRSVNDDKYVLAGYLLHTCVYE